MVYIGYNNDKHCGLAMNIKDYDFYDSSTEKIINTTKGDYVRFIENNPELISSVKEDSYIIKEIKKIEKLDERCNNQIFLTEKEAQIIEAFSLKSYEDLYNFIKAILEYKEFINPTLLNKIVLYYSKKIDRISDCGDYYHICSGDGQYKLEKKYGLVPEKGDLLLSHQKGNNINVNYIFINGKKIFYNDDDTLGLKIEEFYLKSGNDYIKTNYYNKKENEDDINMKEKGLNEYFKGKLAENIKEDSSFNQKMDYVNIFTKTMDFLNEFNTEEGIRGWWEEWISLNKDNMTEWRYYSDIGTFAIGFILDKNGDTRKGYGLRTP